MSVEEENMAIERAVLIGIFNNRDMSVAEKYIDENWIYHAPGGVLEKGRDFWYEFHTRILDAFTDMEVTFEDQFAIGNKVCARTYSSGKFTGPGDLLGFPPNGREFKKVESITIGYYRDGKEVEIWDAIDYLAMFQQLGLVGPVGKSSQAWV